ncbi:DNA ligase D [Candidatus Parcubacteria bacterium]|nr:DNA ligase D [Candidatus Parcubacteria bacterium]
MALSEYKRKREFEKTPEPSDKDRQKKEKGSKNPIFVIQKHNARRLHYDFRLEAGGVLKSWAVPKGPSLDPRDKRLAMMVEDHPLSYANFEGVIPAGNYGAGEVIVWDNGTFRAIGVPEEETEKAVLEGTEKGKLSVVLHGKKLKGEFHLTKIKSNRDDKDNSWLLIKKNDEYADTEKSILDDEESVQTSRTIHDLEQKEKNIPREPMPHQIKPMLATLTTKPFDREGWIFEVKWDGYRAIAEVQNGNVDLHSRNFISFKEVFSPVVRALKKTTHQVVLDGEIVALDEKGKSKFQLLQNYKKTREGNLVYYVFDILYLDGHNLMNLHTIDRKELLKKFLDNEQFSNIRFSAHVEKEGEAFFNEIKKQGLEGIVAKNARSIYRPGKRTEDWLKIKTEMRQEAVIAGFTEPRGGRQKFGALVLGVYDEKKDLIYIGHTGGGFNDESLADVFEKLKPLEQKKSPFTAVPKTNAPVHWVKPILVAEVKFNEWTGDGHMRMPIFLGLREDKDPHKIRKEEPIETKPPLELLNSKKMNEKKITVEGKELTVSNVKKLYWPDDGYTKGDLIDYYKKIAPILVPYLKDRPESLHRFPNGIDYEGFYQKDVERKNLPDWIETCIIHSESNDKDVDYLLCQNQSTLVYMANLGCIEINPWNSRVKHLDNPDYIIVDLDPLNIGFEEVIQVAQTVKEVLDDLKIEGYPKTSGATGIHIYIPLGSRYHYDEARAFAEIIANLTHERLPKITSIERSPSKRNKKVYVDYLQNIRGQTLAAAYSLRPRPKAPVSTPLIWRGQTLAAAYSLRPRPKAPVSTPLIWNEVKSGLYPEQFTIKNIFKRIEKIGDIWKPVIHTKTNIKRALDRIAQKTKEA